VLPSTALWAGPSASSGQALRQAQGRQGESVGFGSVKRIFVVIMAVVGQKTLDLSDAFLVKYLDFAHFKEER
jgi:hypothetical protein